MIAAIYARKSTEQTGVADEQKSVARQVERARAYALRKGWTVDEACVFIDDGISGAEFANRPGFLRLMNALKPRPAFQVLIMSEESRLGRESIETAYALKQLVTAGVRVFFYFEDRERTLDSPTDKIMLSLTAFADELEREKARQRTYDAMIRKARAGHVTGGRVFGYDNVEILGASGRRSHVIRRINDREAAVVRRIFTLCAEGVGKARIARLLNEEGAPAPRPSHRSRPQGWAASSVHEVLYRELYRGVIVWNRSKKRNQWGQQKQKARPTSDHLRVPAPELRVVAEPIWQAAHERLDESRALYLRSTKGQVWGRPPSAMDAKYLLSGLAECGRCGGTIEVRSRSHGRHRAYFYMCSTHRRRGASICRGLDVPMERADEAILATVEATLLDPDMLERACVRAVADDALRADSAATKVELLNRQRMILQELRRLTDHLAAGDDSRSLREGIASREAEVARIDRELARLERATGPTQTPEAAIAQLEALLADLRAVLRRHAPEARQMLRRLLRGRVVMTPEVRDEQPGYRVRGSATVEPLLNVVMRPEGEASGSVAQAMASPTGFEPVFRP
ncbi:MAG: recombinase family protein [Vicinamibacterales bacterium]